MLLEPHKCPKCKALAHGILGQVPGLALVVFSEDGGERSAECDYLGETKMDWDSQTEVRDYQNHVTCQCPSGHQWQAMLDGQHDSGGPVTLDLFTGVVKILERLHGEKFCGDINHVLIGPLAQIEASYQALEDVSRKAKSKAKKRPAKR